MRLYCVQWCDRDRGWTDLPGTANAKEHACIREMEVLSAREPHKVMRVWRKPHGWVPPEPPTEEPVREVEEPYTPYQPLQVADLSEVQQKTLFSMWVEAEQPGFAEAVEGSKLQEYLTRLMQTGEAWQRAMFTP